MKTYLAQLEKSRTTWFLLGSFLLFFFFRFPSLIEPYWYGDEGIYGTIGIALTHGRALYTGIWDNKPPLLYLTYALFSSDQFLIRLASLLVGLGAVACFFFLSRKLFKKNNISFVLTVLFCFLFGTPIAEGNIANAENFMLFPLLAAALLIWNTSKKQTIAQLFSAAAGLLVGIACLYKIVAVFDFSAFFLFILYTHIPSSTPWRTSRSLQTWRLALSRLIPYTSGFMLPIGITIGYFFFKGQGAAFFHAIFSSNIGYVGYANTFIIPQGLLLLKFLLLVSALWLLFRKRTSLEKPALFVLLWLSFGLFDSLFSQRNYTHYFLMVLPSLLLFLGLPSLLKTRVMYIIFFIVAIGGIGTTLYFLSGRFNQLPYYINFLEYISNKKSITSYQSFFDSKTPRDYMIADYLRINTTPYEPIFIWGNSAQIYVLSHTLPVGMYTVAYHVTSTKQTLMHTDQAINQEKPKYIVILSDSSNFPFHLLHYMYKISLAGNIVYERTH